MPEDVVAHASKLNANHARRSIIEGQAVLHHSLNQGTWRRFRDEERNNNSQVIKPGEGKMIFTYCIQEGRSNGKDFTVVRAGSSYRQVVRAGRRVKST